MKPVCRFGAQYLDRVWVTSTGVDLSQLSDVALNDLEQRTMGLIQELGPTDHYKRKHRLQIKACRDDLMFIEFEKHRRSQLTRIDICGMEGFIRGHLSKRVWHKIIAADNGPCPPGYTSVFQHNGKWYLCPKGETPEEYWLYDEMYRVELPSYFAATDLIGTQHVNLPGFVVRRLVDAGVAKIEQLDDPLDKGGAK